MKTYTYTVYHILGIKIGCTTELQKRMKVQGFTNYEILWQEEGDFEFGWIAGDKELELQKQYGYQIDTSHYQISRQNRLDGRSHEASSRGGLTQGPIQGNLNKINKTGVCGIPEELMNVYRSSGGKTQGNKNLESGHFDNIRILANIENQKKVTCIHCGTIANKLNHGKWHGDKCKKRHEI